MKQANRGSRPVGVTVHALHAVPGRHRAGAAARRAVWLLLLVLVRTPAPAAAQDFPGRSAWWGGVGAGALLAGALLADGEVREEVFLESNARLLPAARAASALAEPAVALPAVALVFGIGRLAGRPALAGAAVQGAASLALATAAAGAVKVVIGRTRPDAGADQDELHPFSLAGRRQSFPSGHTAAAFALAAVAAQHVHGPATGAIFGLAGVVGWSRIYRDAHWSSDVAAGALLGLGSARLAQHWIHAPEAVTPGVWVVPGGVGLRLSIPAGR